MVPINPGTEADLALGIAAVLVDGNMLDSGAVSGLGSWKSDLLATYATDKVSQTTGVAAEVIVDLAKGFAGAKRPLALFGRGKGLVSGSLRETAAVCTLNALAGNINQEGGMWAVPEADYIQWPDVATDNLASAGLEQPRLDGAGAGKYADARYLTHRLADSVNGGEPTPCRLVAGGRGQSCHDLPDTQRVKAAFARIPFIVSFSSFQDETAAMADLLLPDHVYLERYEDVPVGAGLAQRMIGLSKPVVSPQFNTRHLGEVLIVTARAMGGFIADAFPWDDYETCLGETLAEKWETLMETGVWVQADTDPVADTLQLAGMDAPAVQAEGDVNSFPCCWCPMTPFSSPADISARPPS